MKNFKFYKLLVFMLALFILPALLGCGKIPKTYVMKETQKEMSTQLARIYQAKVKSEAISHATFSAIESTNSLGLITDLQAFNCYKALCAYDASYKTYCDKATTYYDAEMNGGAITTKDMADGLISNLSADRDLLVNTYTTITGEPLDIPKLE